MMLPLLLAASALAAGASAERKCGTMVREYPFSVVFRDGQFYRLPNPIGPTDHVSIVPHCYPWVAYLTGDAWPGNADAVQCGGALIADKWILTAAHCFDAEQPTRVVLGANMIPEGSPPADTVAIKRAVKHPQYDAGSGAYDFALVELSEPTGRKEVHPVCLPAASDDFRGATDRPRALVAGWVENKNAELREYLLGVRPCASAAADKLCAGVDYPYACMIGGGYPLVLPQHATGFGRGSDTQIMVVGVQTADKCFGTGEESTFAHVPAARQWIQEVAGV